MPETNSDWVNEFANALGGTVSKTPPSPQPVISQSKARTQPAVPSQTSPAHAPIACPICNQIDRMAKVSAIVRAGTSSGSYSGTVSTFGKKNDSDSIGWTSLSGSSTTRLAQQLQMPQQPGGCLQAVLYVVGAFFLALGIVSLAALVLIVVLGMDFSSPALGDSVLMVAVQTFIYLLIGIFVISQARRIKNKHQKVDMPRWRLAREKWDTLFYCERCDVVFQSGTNPDPVHIDHFQAYLYRY
jgi:hypothetical protein